MSQNLTNAAQRALDRHGEDATLRRYALGGYDDQGDPTFTEKEETVRIALGRPAEAERAVAAAGENVSVDMVGHVKSTHAPISGMASESSTGDPDRPDEIERANGDVLELIDAQDEANGLLRLELRVERRGSGGPV